MDNIKALMSGRRLEEINHNILELIERVEDAQLQQEQSNISASSPHDQQQQPLLTTIQKLRESLIQLISRLDLFLHPETKKDLNLKAESLKYEFHNWLNTQGMAVIEQKIENQIANLIKSK